MEKASLTDVRLFFGMSAPQLRQEWSALTPEDKQEIIDMLTAEKEAGRWTPPAK